MTDLETAFYIIAIIYMIVMFILFIGLLVALLIIKQRVNALHDMAEEKINQVKRATNKAALLFATVRHFVKR